MAALCRADFVSILELASTLGVSHMTVRRDLQLLGRAGKVRPVHGGAALRHGASMGSGGRRADALTGACAGLGAAAAGLLAETDAIAIAAGAAPLAVAAALPAGFSGSVVTNSLPVLQRLVSRDRVRVVFLGGEFAPDTAAFVGPLTAQHAAGTRAADAVDPRGVYIHSDTERATVRALMDVADAVGLLAEHSAFSSNAPMQVCELQRLSSLITDRQPPARIAQAPDRAGVRTLVTTSVTNLAGDRADGRRPNGSGRSV